MPPNYWHSNKQTQELILEMTKPGIPGLPLDVSKGGLNPGTFAHELLAISYAGWISPKFQLQVNQVFLDYKSGKFKPENMSSYDIFKLGLEFEKVGC